MPVFDNNQRRKETLSPSQPVKTKAIFKDIATRGHFPQGNTENIRGFHKHQLPSGYAHDFSMIPIHTGQSSTVHNQKPGLSRILSKLGNGQKMDERIRGKMESAMGTDFTNVHIHTDSEADNLNQRLQTNACTLGNDIFFGSNTYHPDSEHCQELIAHELAHVVQQKGGEFRTGELGVSRPGDRQESEAHVAAHEVVSTGRLTTTLTPVAPGFAGLWTTPRLNSVEWNEYDRLRTIAEQRGYRFSVQAEDEYGPTRWSVIPPGGTAATLTRADILQQLSEWTGESLTGQEGVHQDSLPSWLSSDAASFIAEIRAGSRHGAGIWTFGPSTIIERSYTDPESDRTTTFRRQTLSQVVWVGNGVVECFAFASTNRGDYSSSGTFNSWQDWNYQMYIRVIQQQMQPSVARAQMMRMDEDLALWVTLTVAANAVGP